MTRRATTWLTSTITSTLRLAASSVPRVIALVAAAISVVSATTATIWFRPGQHALIGHQAGRRAARHAADQHRSIGPGERVLRGVGSGDRCHRLRLPLAIERRRQHLLVEV